MDPDQAGHCVGPDLGPNCFPKVISREQKLQVERKEQIMTLCMLGNITGFCCRLQTFFSKLFFSKNTIRVTNALDPDQDRHSVGPDLGPNCLQSKERVNILK